MGLEAALLLAKNHKVYASMRSLKSEPEVLSRAKKEKVKLETLALDVTDVQSIGDAVRAIIQKEGRIDVLINNAGFGMMGPFELLSEEDIQKQFNVNYLGYVRCIQAVLPQMRKQKSGTIINVSSVAGVSGLAFCSAYASAKFAIEGLSECLRAELQPFGIDVRLVEPGPVATNFDKEMTLGHRQLKSNPYEKNIQKTFESFKQMLQQGQSSKEAAQTYVEAVEDTSARFRFQTSLQAQLMIAKKLKDRKGYSQLL